MGGFQGLGSHPSRARRGDDELRLRSRPGPRIRHAADRAADLARLSHRRRAIGDRDHRRADPPPQERRGAGRLGGDPRGGVEKPRAGFDVLGLSTGAAVAADLPPRIRRTQSQPQHLPHQGWALVHHPRHGCPRSEEPRASARQIQRAGRSATAAARHRSQGTASAGDGGDRRSALAHARRGAAFCPRLDLQGHAVAGGAGGRPPLGAAAQAARERARRALAGAQDLRRDRAPGARPLVPLPDQQVAQQQDELAGRATGAIARRGYRGGARRSRAPAERAGRAAPGREPAPFGDAQQAVPAARDQDLRFRLVSRFGRRHAVSRGDGRGKLQGRVEGQSRHAAGGDGAGRRPRRARRRDGAASRGQGPRHGRQFPQQEFGQARHLAQHPPPEGARDREGHGAHLRCRRRGVLARRPAAPGSRL